MIIQNQKYMNTKSHRDDRNATPTGLAVYDVNGFYNLVTPSELRDNGLNGFHMHFTYTGFAIK